MVSTVRTLEICYAKCSWTHPPCLVCPAMTFAQFSSVTRFSVVNCAFDTVSDLQRLISALLRLSNLRLHYIKCARLHPLRTKYHGNKLHLVSLSLSLRARPVEIQDELLDWLCGAPSRYTIHTPEVDMEGGSHAAVDKFLVSIGASLKHLALQTLRSQLRPSRSPLLIAFQYFYPPFSL
ncbi:hypothetical protein AcV5_003749 [Taiwanofungus camphoratus]|nr:hypothetical protein AcV5_003749 [Antrodia cinnamomea]